MNAQKMFRTVTVASLLLGIGLTHVNVVSAGDVPPGPRGMRTQCNSTSGDIPPGPRGGSVATCVATAGDIPPGPR